VPAALGFLFLGPWIIHLLFHGGEWTYQSTSLTWLALKFYALAIPVYSFNKILTSSFYAYQDTKTPVKILFFTVAVNLLCNFVLIGPLKQGGLALSTAISSTVNFFLLNRALAKKMGSLPYADLSRSLLRLTPGIALLLILLSGLAYFCPYPLDTSGHVPYVQAVLVVGSGVGLGAVLYLTAAHLSGAPQMQIISEMLQRKIKR
jgi:putative peptidoglycan lipid II flippase